MSSAHEGQARLDLEQVPSEVRAAFEAAFEGQDVLLTLGEKVLGSLEFHAGLRDGIVLDFPATRWQQTPHVDGVHVVATTMPLSDAARGRLSADFGEDFVVLDILDAPPTAEVLLTHPVSPQLLARLQEQFPAARVVVTEIDDPELGVRFAGPVGRLLDAGASAYLPPRPLDHVAAGVRACLPQNDVAELIQDGASAKTLEGGKSSGS